jgi:hypothetical protein
LFFCHITKVWYISKLKGLAPPAAVLARKNGFDPFLTAHRGNGLTGQPLFDVSPALKAGKLAMPFNH